MRIRLLDALREAPATVQQLEQATGASQQNISKQTFLGGATAENHDLQEVLKEKTWLVICVVIVLGFLLLLLALQAPLVAAAGVLTNPPRSPRARRR